MFTRNRGPIRLEDDEEKQLDEKAPLSIQAQPVTVAAELEAGSKICLA